MSPMQLVLLLTMFTILKSYFLSNNQLSWSQASQYCQSHCNSNLANLHNNVQIQSVSNLLLHFKPVNGSHNSSLITWIGLYDNDLSLDRNWTFTDNTRFNHSVFADESIFTASSKSASSNCIGINRTQTNTSNPYKLVPMNCNITQGFLCNSCDGETTKYIVIQEPTHWRNAGNLCQSHYGTNLASIHSNSDYDELQSLTNILGHDAWIGLNDFHRTNLSTKNGTTIWREFEHADGTLWDLQE